MGIVVAVSEESLEIEKIRLEYEERRKDLQTLLDSSKSRECQLIALYEESRKLWIAGNFKALSELLDAEGFHYFRELKEALQRQGEKVVDLSEKLGGISRNLEKGIVCPKCDGVGTVVLEKRYERSGGQIIPIAKMQDCEFCRGSGKITLRSS